MSLSNPTLNFIPNFFSSIIYIYVYVLCYLTTVYSDTKFVNQCMMHETGFTHDCKFKQKMWTTWDHGCILKSQEFVCPKRYMINILVYRLIYTGHRKTAGREEFHFFEFQYTCANSCIYIHFISLPIVTKKSNWDRTP